MSEKGHSKIYVTTQFEGYHKWDNAPDCVVFLRNWHRHIFHVKVTLPVNHNDREIEFFMLKAEVNEIIATHITKSDTGSCEQIGEIISEKLFQLYNREITVEVSEDKENGAITTYP